MAGAGEREAMRAATARLGDALVQVTRRPAARTADPLALLDRVPADRFVEMAAYHRVPGVAYRALAELGHDDEAFAGLRGSYQMAAMGHGRCLVELGAVVDAFAALRRPWMVVKGPVLVELGYADTGARLYEDLDLVVHPSEMATAMALIEGAGGRATDVNWPLSTRSGRAELSMILPAGMPADLHWHLLVTSAIRSRFSVRMDEMADRLRKVTIGGIEVPTLDAVDSALYLGVHGSLSGGHQLVWLKDLEMVLTRDPVDWDELIRRARRWRVDLVAAVQLERARSVLGAPVPDTVVETLAAGAPWWRWWQREEARLGGRRWGGYDHTGRTFVAATSATTSAGLVQLTRSVLDEVVGPAIARPWRALGSETTETVPKLYQPIGGPEARSEYLRMAAATGWG
jgi:hypothetical protein